MWGGDYVQGSGFMIQTDTLIHSYLRNYTEDHLMGLYSLFGYTRLVEESLKLYTKPP